jgi:hypothetical protein
VNGRAYRDSLSQKKPSAISRQPSALVAPFSRTLKRARYRSVLKRARYIATKRVRNIPRARARHPPKACSIIAKRPGCLPLSAIFLMRLIRLIRPIPASHATLQPPLAGISPQLAEMSHLDASGMRIFIKNTRRLGR